AIFTQPDIVRQLPQDAWNNGENVIEQQDILAQTADARAVQPFMGKYFDSINSLVFASSQDIDHMLGHNKGKSPEKDKKGFGDGSGTGNADYVTTMVSVEGDSVELSEPVSTRMAVETWLLNFKSAMYITIRDQIQITLQAHSVMPRTEWIFMFPAQVFLAVDQITWTAGATEALESDARSEQKEIHPVDVHARNIVETLVREKSSSSDAFEWMRNLRYYWDQDEDEFIVRQTSTEFVYGYEYLGNSPRLVIIPLTDRCYITLTLSLHLHLGGNPAGPTGTGKTETT
ncbi:MAG: putative dynein heavy chain, partial [Streblomastix strix]